MSSVSAHSQVTLQTGDINSKENSMGGSISSNLNNNYPLPFYNSTIQSTNRPPLPLSETESLSIASSLSESLDEPVSPVFSQVPVVAVDVACEEVDNIPNAQPLYAEAVVTLWKPILSEELIQYDIDNEGSFETNTSVNQTPGKKKNKGFNCFCCRKNHHHHRHRSSGQYMDGQTPQAVSSTNFAGYKTPEVLSLHSAEDIVIIPSEVFPLEMVTTADFPIPTPTINPIPITSPTNILAPVPTVPTPSPSSYSAHVKKVKSRKPRRTRVPEKPDNPMSLWGLIKTAMGKDITKMPLPVNFSEPLSMLQRLAEDYEYSSVLDNASMKTDTLEQLAHVAAFTISSYASTAVRTAKPFNPLLGETFEFDRTDDLGWRCIAEKVCHHPPIAVLHCESSGWVQWQQFTMKSNFRGTYLEIHPLGVAHLRFKTSDNHYTWRKVSTIVRNLYIGKPYIEQEGEMDIINHTTNEWCHLKFTTGGMFSRDRNVHGKVFTKTGEPKWDIHGTWDKEVRATKLDEKGKPIPSETRILWLNSPLPSDADKHYCFSQFTCQLNDMEDGVAPTDSRRRTDQRLMENGQWDEANIEKQRLEDKQRESMKRRTLEGNKKHSTASHLNAKTLITATSGKNVPVGGPEDGVEPFYTPCWFSRQRDPISGQYIYLFNGDYWNCKDNQDWGRCPLLYDK